MFAIQLIGQICMYITLSESFGKDIDYQNQGGSDVNKQRYID